MSARALSPLEKHNRREYSLARRAQLLARNLCINGESHGRAEIGKVKCLRCLLAHRSHARTARQACTRRPHDPCLENCERKDEQ